jgi:hypothetical protein
MTDTSLFYSMRPAFPWSVYPVGLPALAVVAGLIVVITLWTYLGHPQATRRRVFVVLALRLAALIVALLTALRPSVGFQEEPKVPSVLVIGIDLSESMTVKDEVNNQARIDAVRKVLDKCQPTLDELANEHNVNVVMYKFGPPDFSPETSRYDPKDPADAKRSDYGSYLNRTFEKWQGERFLRGHILVGDGVDNGTAFAAITEAARWGRRNCPVSTFVVGSEDTPGDATDLIVTGVSCEPSPAPIKTPVTVTARVSAYKLQGARVKAHVFINDKEEKVEEVTLHKVKDNDVKIEIKAPPTPGEVKVKVKFEKLPGEVSDLNNESETYLTVTKEGVRVLVIDRMRVENVRLLAALQSEKRFDVVAVWRQFDGPPPAEEAPLLDLDNQAYDVVIIGNVSYGQLRAAAPGLAEKLVERVTKKGTGLMFLGGEAAFKDLPLPPPGAPGTREQLVFTDLVPAFPGDIKESLDAKKRAQWLYQTVPTAAGMTQSVMKIAKTVEESRQLWDELNSATRPSVRLSGYVHLTPKANATPYAWTTPAAPAANSAEQQKGDALLVGAQLGGEGSKGRVLAFGGFDTYLWEQLGQPKTRQGVEIHNRFWRQCVLWLAHQEEEEGQVYVRPKFRRLPVAGDQEIRVGLKTPGGGDDPNAKLAVKVLAPGEDEAKATPLQTVKDKDGEKLLFKPRAPGEYVVVVTAPVIGPDGQPVTDAEGKPMEHRGTARFIAYPEVSEEMLKVAADSDFMRKIADSSGGKALRLEDLPAFLKELKAQPSDQLKPKPKYYPDWRRNHSKGFLPAWLALFVTFIGAEWALRRLWGMV